MRNLSRVIALVLSLIFLAFPVRAVNSLDIVINEIAWMGTEISYNDEWIEFYNDTDSPINLDGWVLKALDGTPKINLKGIISGKGFYLLERTDDNTLPNIPADQIYTGALGNDGEHLQLYDNLGNLIDAVDCSSSWFTGDNSTKQTMERKNPQLSGSVSSNWQTSQNPSGTPRAKNSVFAETEPEPKEKEPKPIIEETVDVKHQQITYPAGIIINELLPSPEGSDEKEEWIEIFNQNNFEVDLSNWQITDTEGKTTIYTFPAGTKISTQGFLVLSRPTTKITLNNEGDSLNLIQPDGKIVDSVNYEKAPSGQSYNRTSSGSRAIAKGGEEDSSSSSWAWSAILTPGWANVIPAQKTEEAETLGKAGKIDINAAPLKDLVKIVHIGEVRALELISLRPFYSLDDLTRIKGIGDKALEEIKKQGLAWVDPTLEPPQIEKTEPPNKGLTATAELPKSFDFARARQTPKSLFVFLTALSIAIFSGIIILTLKRKLKNLDLSGKIE